jgi:hypothetical protein
MDLVDIFIFGVLFFLILAISVILNPPERWVKFFVKKRSEHDAGDIDDPDRG